MGSRWSKGVAGAAGSWSPFSSPEEHDEAVAAVPRAAGGSEPRRQRGCGICRTARWRCRGRGAGCHANRRGDPRLWTQILAGNAPAAVAAVLRDVAADLEQVVVALESLGPEPTGEVVAPGARATLARK